MADIRIKVELDDFVIYLKKFSDDFDAVAADALNYAAFTLRKSWLALMDKNLHKPVNFTKAVFVNQADKKNLQALVFIPQIQSEYLQRVVNGGLRKPGDYGTLKRSILTPVGTGALDADGNFPGGPTRWLAAVIDGKIPGTFIQKNSKGQSAIYTKRTNDKLKLLAVFEQTTKYEVDLPLFGELDVVEDALTRKLQEAMANIAS